VYKVISLQYKNWSYIFRKCKSYAWTKICEKCFALCDVKYFCYFEI